METVTIQLSKESYDFLKNLAREIATQDNRATAQPYFFACREVYEHPVAEDNDYDKEYFIDEEGQAWGSLDELKEAWPSTPIHKIRKAYVKFGRRVTNIFFTEKAYKRHLELNRHNLRDPDSFLYHAFRNHELSQLFQFLKELDGLNPVTAKDGSGNNESGGS